MYVYIYIFTYIIAVVMIIIYQIIKSVNLIKLLLHNIHHEQLHHLIPNKLFPAPLLALDEGQIQLLRGAEETPHKVQPRASDFKGVPASGKWGYPNSTLHGLC